jgi:hypothetical protein
MYRLLTIQGDPKTVKGEKHGYMTAIMYLAPSDLSGRQLCPFAKQAGCEASCLNTAGRGAFSQTQAARLRRAHMFNDERPSFWRQLIGEIEEFQLKAEKNGMTPVIRLNGTSDIVWEQIPVIDENTTIAKNIFQMFPTIRFYDYTKIAKRFHRPLPANYTLTLSYSEADAKFTEVCWQTFHEHGANLVMVVKDDQLKDLMAADLKAHKFESVIDGDENDLRFLDPKGSVVLLKAKGKARNETNGFVLTELP